MHVVALNDHDLRNREEGGRVALVLRWDHPEGAKDSPPHPIRALLLSEELIERPDWSQREVAALALALVEVLVDVQW